MSGAANWVRVAGVSDVAPGEMLGVDVHGRKIALFHLEDGTWHATDNICTHAFAMLTDGWFEGREIECPLHAGRFDVTNGKALCPPVEKDLETYKVLIDNESVFVELKQ